MQDLSAVGLGQHQQIIILSGGTLVQNSSSNNMNGNTFNGDVNGTIGQAGGDLTQTATTTITFSDQQVKESETLINELKSFISTLPESQDKTDALSDVTQLQEAVKNKNLERAKKVWGMFGDIVRTSSAGLAIAKLFGWM